MPTFSFIPTKGKQNKVDTKYYIIEKGVCGVVFITPQASFYVLYNKQKYDIKPECYNCKGYTNIYRQGDNRTKLPTIYIRHKDYSHRVSSLHWLPFTAGVIAYGNIVKRNDKVYFSIKKTEIDYDNEIAKQALSIYKLYYDTIIKIQKDKLINICNGF